MLLYISKFANTPDQVNLGRIAAILYGRRKSGFYILFITTSFHKIRWLYNTRAMRNDELDKIKAIKTTMKPKKKAANT